MTTPAPPVAYHEDFERHLGELPKREKAHTREGDAIAAARRRLPMTEVPPDTTVIGRNGPVPFGDVFEGRDELVVYSHMFYDGKPWEWQCEGCTRNAWVMGDAADAAYLNANGITFAVLGDGPYEQIAAFRDFMGYTVRRWGPEMAVDRCPSGPALVPPGSANKPDSSVTDARPPALGRNAGRSSGGHPPDQECNPGTHRCVRSHRR